MTRLALELSLPAVAAWKGGGGPALSGAATLLGAETNGLAFAASDDSMEIRDTVTPANNYVGSAVAKFGNVRASSAYTTGSTGSLEWAPENLLTQSQTLTAGAWAVNNGSITADVIAAPDGTMTGDRLNALASSNSTAYNVTTFAVPGVFTWSFYAKKGTANFFYLDPYDGAAHPSWFNLATGVAGTNSAGSTSAITDAGNGWYRCSVTRSTIATSLYLSVGVSDADNSTVCAAPVTVFLWGGMYNHGATAGAYLVTTSSAVNALRRDYDARVTGPKYLIEEARTNLAIFSNNFSDGAWGKDNISVAQNVTGIDGTTSAWTVTDNSTLGEHRFYFNAGAVAGPHSIYAKAGTAGFLGLSTAGSDYVIFNLSTGAIDSSSLATGTISPAGNGFYRCSMIPNASGLYLIANMGRTALEARSGGNYAGTGSTIIVTSSQIEVGASVSSYIPTVGAAVTRAVDIIPAIATSTFPYSATAGTIYHKFNTPAFVPSNVQIVSMLWDATDNERVFLMSNNNGASGVLQVDDGGVTQATFPFTNAYTSHKIAIAWAVNNVRACKDGTLIGVDDTVATLPTMNKWTIGNHAPGTTWPLSGYLFDGLYLPRRMTNAEIQTVTTP